MDKSRFSHFVILAGMRTGSNLLEQTLNSVEGVCCHGELFNPVFIGRPKFDECFGFSLKDRDTRPLELLEAMQREGGKFPGYRHFDGHDERVLDHVLANRACAKIVLTRNPIDSYVSLKLARASGQWMLTTHRNKSATTQIEFDAEEYSEFVAGRAAFLDRIRKALQTSGQAAFEVDYEDLHDAEVLSGLLEFLGHGGKSASPDSTLKKQNTSELREKVLNFDAMQSAIAETALSTLDTSRLIDAPRGPAVRSYVAAPLSGLIFLPVPGGPNSEIEEWLSEVEKNAGGPLTRGMNQKQLRELRTSYSDLRSFTVLRHPVLRAFAAFCHHSTPGSDGFKSDLQDLLERRFGLNVKKDADPLKTRRLTFLAYLRLLKSTLAGQSGIGAAPVWRSQISVLQGVARVTVPDVVLREGNIMPDLARLGVRADVPDFQIRQKDVRSLLNGIYDGSVEKAVRSVYGRDYSAFGFSEWSAGA